MSSPPPAAAPRKRRWFWPVAWLVLIALFLRWCAQPSEPHPDDAAAASKLINALGAYRNEHGRYPASVRDLQPKYLADPPPFPPGMYFYYLGTDKGEACWIAYKTPSLMTDSVEEYDCVTREWRTRQYYQAKTAPSEKAEVIPKP